MNFRLITILLLITTLLTAQSQTGRAQPSRKIRLSPVALGLDLPDSYKQRTFIKGLAGFVNKIDQLVGAMILIEDNNKTSVLTRFVRNDKPPVVTTATSDVIYNAKIDSKFKYNGAYSIASTKIEKDRICELILTDVGYAFLPEDYIPYLEICRAATNVSPEIRSKAYYIRSAKLTTVYTRIYQKMIGDADVNGVVFSVGGEVYSSSDQFRVDYIVSVDLVSLEKLLALQNCNELINNEEIARREKAEQARMAALRADEERKARENELNAAKAQVEDMKRALSHSVEKSAELQRQLMTRLPGTHILLNETIDGTFPAHHPDPTVPKNLVQLQDAIRQANELGQKAQTEQQLVESRERVILTFKNKEGKTLDVGSLDELSPEKLRELGFDVEILRNTPNGGK